MNYLEKTIKLAIKKEITTKDLLMNLKREMAKKYSIPYPSNMALIKEYQEMVKNEKIKASPVLEKILQVRPVRSLSGVASISLLVSPNPKWSKEKRHKTCPYNCLFCPTPKNLPKSYLENEPAVMRAMANNFNPFKQITSRLKALQLTGHPTDKIELIIIGGTWSYLPKRYRTWFIKKSFDACNKSISKNLKIAQTTNETTKKRIIGITVETRPDLINKKEIRYLRKLGITRVELGVQSIYNEILDLNNRAEKIEATIQATKLLKNTGFKVCYHIMPNLYGSKIEKDIQVFKELFNNPVFKPDYLKIYPCMVVENSNLFLLWKEKKYIPYTDSELIFLLKTIKQFIPVYCRVIRIIRDIPSGYIVGGSKISNLNQIILREMKKEGKRCLCIRCREIRGKYSPKTKLKIFKQSYNSSGGEEIFLSWEDEERKNIYSLLRLRLARSQEQSAIFPVLADSAIIREVHTYGKIQAINENNQDDSPQHTGLGKKLIKKAEKIAKNRGYKKMTIISGVGVRKYYEKLGYFLEETYMIKQL